LSIGERDDPELILSIRLISRGKIFSPLDHRSGKHLLVTLRVEEDGNGDDSHLCDTFVFGEISLFIVLLEFSILRRGGVEYDRALSCTILKLAAFFDKIA